MATWAHLLVAAILAAVPLATVNCKSHKRPSANVTSLLKRIKELEAACEANMNGSPQCPFSFVDVASIENDKNGTIPGGFVVDHDTSTTLFPCRANVNGALVPGTALKYQKSPLKIACNVPYEGKEHRFLSDFQLLLSPDSYNFRWLKKSPQGILPRNSIAGGWDANSTALFIGRCKMSNDPVRDYAIGWVAADFTDTLIYSVDDVRHLCTDYEVLECSQ